MLLTILTGICMGLLGFLIGYLIGSTKSNGNSPY